MNKILFFSSSTCGPCKVMKSYMTEELIDTYNIKILSAEKDFDDFIQHKVQSVPTLIKLEENKETKRLVGFKTLEEIKGL